ncbi:ATP-binding protein [Microbispora siamensis]|uniref:ATP-binding protein n=1 Tax=Microbispora siamensis TaxID=564413 RepID=UPI00194EACE8|nr:tetratricopeptide repeat protein [Microbispora siamensis]
MAALPRPRLPDGPVRQLFDALHDLHHQAGWPSLREMAGEVGCSRTTISAAFSTARVPRWGLLELIVETLHGDVEHFHRLWLAATTPRPPAAAETAASATAPAAVPRQLPTDVRGFTGRAHELAALDPLLRPSGPAAIALVSGPAGVGKTALAVHWAHRVAAHFPDGQLYLNLRGYDPDQPMEPGEALETLLRALGVPDSAIPQRESERAARLRTLTADRRMLVLLDNVHTVAQVRPLLPGSGSCLVLITSRDTLPALVARHGAVRIGLDLLSGQEAVALLRTLLGGRVDAQPGQAAALAELCARLPLALRVAAELAIARPRLTLADLVGQLRDESRRLDLLAAGDDEYTAVRAVFSWSRRNLSAAADRAFLLLSVHPYADLDLLAVAALLGTDQTVAARLVDVLCQSHLVEETTTGRYSMHDLLRAYGAEQDHADAAPALTRLADHYLAAVPSHDGNWLERELPNLLTLARTRPSHAGPLSAALSGHLDTRGQFGAALALHGHALEAADSPEERACALNRLGVTHRRLGDYAAAEERHRAALSLYRGGGDLAGQAEALHGLGIVCWRGGRYTEARDHLLEALALREALGDRTAQGTVLYSLGTVHLQLGEYRQAIAHHVRALGLHRDTGNQLGESRALNNLGAAYERLGRLGEAQEHYEQALALNQKIGNQVGVAVALTNLGNVRTKLGHWDEARLCHDSALPIYLEAGYRVGEADSRCGLGSLELRQGRHREALEQFHLAVTTAREIGEAETETSALVGLGDTLSAMGQREAAQAHYDAALARVAATGDRYEEARALVGIARLHGGTPRAAEAWRRALTLFDELDLPEADEVRRRLAEF